MKKIISTTAVVMMVMLLSLPSVAREKTRINFDWKFKIGDFEGAKNVDYNDSDWEVVNLPHDGSIYGEFVQDTLGGNRRNGYRPRNIGWYRKDLNIEEIQPGKRYIIEFESVYRAAEVWMNGEYCGIAMNGYLDFEYDITSKIKKGNNVISVRYDNTFKDSSRWYTGEGINRDVYLHVLDEVHVARYGTFVSTPKIRDEYANVSIETEVVNESSDSILCKLETAILNTKGDTVAKTVSIVPMASSETYKFQQSAKVDNPEIWELDNPAMYKAVSLVYNDGKLVDTYETKFGIREVEFNNEQGFLLNGEKLLLKGVCLHHDLGPLGAASFEAAWDERLSAVKNDLGCNSIRPSHNPFPKYVLDWCDENGILVYDEAYDKWDEQYYGIGELFDDYWKDDMTTFVKRDRNHPSVFIWGIGNEIVQQQKQEFESVQESVNRVKEVTEFARILDPTRKSTCALYPSRYNGVKYNNPVYYTEQPHQMAFYMDVMSVNYQASFFKKDKPKYPQLIYLVSEMATEDAGYGFYKYDHSYSCGQFYWGGTEYIGESFGWPSKGWINGAIDLTNKMKPVAYSIRSFYSDEPIVQLAVLDEDKMNSKIWNDAKISWKPKYFHWNWEDGKEVTVQAFTNCDSVQLFLNDELIGTESMEGKDRPDFLWKVAYKAGELKGIAYHDGKKIGESILQTAGKAYKIVLESNRKTINADGLDLAYIRAKVVDKNGIVVPSATHNLKFTVDGCATNAGVASGDINSDELWQADTRSVFNGDCQLIIRSNQESGRIRVKASASGIKSAQIELSAN